MRCPVSRNLLFVFFFGWATLKLVALPKTVKRSLLALLPKHLIEQGKSSALLSFGRVIFQAMIVIFALPMYPNDYGYSVPQLISNVK